MQRLDRWISSQGSLSRKEVKNIIGKGLVIVNGIVAKKPDIKIDENSKVVVNGKELSLQKFVYYMMNKPQGVLSATRDKKTETVMDLLPKDFQRSGLFPAGRLDKNTEGFLLITNDGQFAHKVLAPKNKIPKTYYVVLDKPFDFDKLDTEFTNGVIIGEDEETSGAQMTLLEGGLFPKVELVIYEGMFHQVKRMFAVFGLEVTYLKRLKIGGLLLDHSLKLGETKMLNVKEIEKIWQI